MPANEFFEAIVILAAGTSREYKATSGEITVRNSPTWMGTHEKLVDISFESSTLVRRLEEIRLDRGGQTPYVDVHVQTTQGSLFIFNGEVLNAQPNAITVVGFMQKDPNKARVLKEEKRLKEVMTLEKRMEIEKEVQLKNKLIEEPDLNRFRTIDWED